MDTISRRVDILERFFMQHAMSWEAVVELSALLLQSVAEVCDPETTEKVTQRVTAILSDALTRQPPPKI